MGPFAQPIIRGFLLWILVGVLASLGLIFLIAGGLDGISPTTGVLGLQLLALLPLFWFLWKHFNQSLPIRYFFRLDFQPFSWANLLIIWMALIILSYGIEGLTNLVLAMVYPEYVEAVLSEQIIDPQSTIFFNGLTVILATVIGPIMEEFVFRGLLLQRLTIKYGRNVAILGSSFLFGILHFESWLSAAIFGVVMCLVFLVSRNLWIPIMLHVGNNMIAVVLNILQHRQLSLISIAQLHDHIWYYVTSLLAAPALFFLIRQLWLKKHSEIPYDYNLKLAS